MEAGGIEMFERDEAVITCVASSKRLPSHIYSSVCTNGDPVNVRGSLIGVKTI